MSDQNNHRRSPHTWNQLQLPSYAVRQPQLAHMLNERSLDRSLLTWHTPTLADPVYSSLAGNLQNKITEPLGSVDLTVSSISQKNVTSSNCLHLVEHTFQPDYAKNYADIETAASDNSGQKLEQSKEIISSCTENSRDAIESCLNGGLLVRDAKQINNDIIKMPSPKPLLTLLEPLELIKENKHYPKNNNGISLSSKEYTTRLYPSCSKLQAFNLKNSLNPYACNLVISKPDEDTLKHVTSEATNRLSSTQQYKINVPPLLVANKDSIGSSSSNKKRRKRKPSKTALMLNDSDNDLASTELVDLKTYQHTNIAATFNSLLKTGMLETGSFADHQSDLSTANLDNYRQRRNLLSESTLQTKNIDNIEIITKSEETSGSKNDFEDYETIDKIAAMIASTEENEVLLPQKIPNEKINDLRNSLDYDHFTEKNYEDVENKLEEMFAGIEDDRPLSNSMSQNPPSSNIKLLSFDMMYDDSTNKNSVRNTPPKSHQNIVLGGKKKKNFNKTNTPNTIRSKHRKTERNSSAKKNKQTKSGYGKQEQIATSDIIQKYRGPFIHIQTDGCEGVVNTPISEETNDSKQKLKRGCVGQNSNDRNKIRGLHVSTLSLKYDAETTDQTWICVFCKVGPHKAGLGDLFGPYILTTNCEDFQFQKEPKADRCKTIRSKSAMIQGTLAQKEVCTDILAPTFMENTLEWNKLKRKNDEAHIHTSETKTTNTSGVPSTSGYPLDLKDIFFGMAKAGDNSFEVWMHEDCTVWAPGVHIVGTHILGLESSVWNSSRHKCIICYKQGAIINCLQRGCLSEVHLPCAREGKWQLCNTNFKSFCEKHWRSNVIDL